MEAELLLFSEGRSEREEGDAVFFSEDTSDGALLF